MYATLKRVRVILSVLLGLVAITAITTLALGVGVIGGWISRLQIVPLILSAGLPWLVGWIVITFVFGRIYCSTVCPLGTLQDCISRVANYTRKGHRYRYAEPMWSVRWLFLIIMIIAITGLSLTLTFLLDPFFNFNRIMTGVAIPACTLGAVYVSLGTAVGGLAALLIVMFMSAFWGRRLCNTICPVGTGLGLLSISPVLRIDINTDLCIGCNRCVEVCKSSCINPDSHTVDTTRCVVCFNCTEVCCNHAITYTSNRHKLSHPLLMRN